MDDLTSRKTQAKKKAMIEAPNYPGAAPDSAASDERIAAWQEAYKAWHTKRLNTLKNQLVWTDSDTPTIVPNVANVAAFLRYHPDWHDVLAYDEFRGNTILTNPIPGSFEVARNFDGRPIRDEDFAATLEWFQKNKLPRLTKQAVIDAMELVCQENKADPLWQHVRECQKRWDGVPRIDRLFEDYFIAEKKDAYTRELGAKCMMTLVLRALYSGAFQKMVPILEGKQDIAKSKGIACLSPREEWFGDSLPGIHTKDASSYLRGKFLIEIAELSATKRADMDDLKSFITRSVEKYRPPYGRKDIEEPRRCMFWGTTNRDDYLRDETGSCRFYPVRLSSVNVEKITADRDQLLGEAAQRLEDALQSNEQWWEFSDEAKAILNAERNARGEDHPWTSTVLSFVENRIEVAVPEILFARETATPPGLGLSSERCDRKQSLAVTGILKAHGWIRDGKFTSGPWRSQARYVRET